MGKLCADKGYIGRALFENLFLNGIQLGTKVKNNMRNSLMSVADKILLRKRALIEIFTINGAAVHNKRFGMSISLKDIQNLFGIITKIILSSISKSYYSHFGENDMTEYFTEHQIKTVSYPFHQ